MNEEFGVSGATTYLQEHSYHIAALESDLGCDHPTGLTFFGAPEAARYLAPLRTHWHRLEQAFSPDLTR
jgi:carboxypeptidase Q